MDNEKKRKIVRYAITGYLILQVIALAVYYIAFRVEKVTTISIEQMEQPPIFPDYRSVTIPYNIAPLNFRLEIPVEACRAKVEGSASGVSEYDGTNHICFSPREWSRLMTENKGKSISITLSTRTNGEWTRWMPFDIYISDQPIDSHIVYRLIEPGYEKWHIVGIYQRDLSSFDEQPIIRNDMTGYNCINCHSFCMNDPSQMMFHMRAENGGTYIVREGKIDKLNTKTDGTISNMTYPYWHPSGHYITTSVNDIRQFFHSVKEKKMEVFDLESDVIVYDVRRKEILSKASLITKDAFETFPAFSPDGKWLYFCSAPARQMPAEYNKVRYNLCRVAFDPDKGEIRFPIDTLVRADSLSYSFPRISPDGRYLMYTETAYGQFPIWHTDAEIRMMDLEQLTPVDMSALNSPDTESYHSWSGNSDWVVFSSRRDNGLYTLPYICHIGADGKPCKPFLLPQEDPDKYDYQLYSYNIPELTQGAVEVSPYAIQEVAAKNKPEQVLFK